jgi:hypothetical protein
MEKEGQALRNYLKSLNLISDEEMKASELRDLQFQEEIANLKRVNSGDELEEDDEEEEGEGEDDEEDNDDSDRQDGEEGDDESEAIQRNNFGIVSPEKQPQSSPLSKKTRNNPVSSTHVLSLTSSNLETIDQKSIPSSSVIVVNHNNNNNSTSKTPGLSPRIPDSKSSTTFNGTTTNSTKSSNTTTNNVSSINSPTDTELATASLKRKMAMNELCSEQEGRHEQSIRSEAFPLERASENQKEAELSVNDNGGKIDPISDELLKKRRKIVHGTDEVSIAFE